MTRIDRRKLLRLLGAGWLTTKMARMAQAQPAGDAAVPPENAAHAPSLPALTDIAHRTGAVSDDHLELNFWRDDQTLLFLRRIPDQSLFHAVLVDAATGQQTLPEEFNAKNSALMQGRPMTVSIVGSSKQERHYIPPDAALSPDRKWLLWSNFYAPQFQVVAANFEGQQQQWTTGSDSDSKRASLHNHHLWMPDSIHWVELVSRNVDGHYSIRMAHEYRLGEAAPARTIDIHGLQDGLPVGMRQDGMIVMHHGGRESDGQIDLSLVSLEADTAEAMPLILSIPAADVAMDVTLSPQGDRLAWILFQREQDPWLSTLYVADADGAHARPIGSAEHVKIGDKFSAPDALRWLPNGKQVSFAYKGVIHTIAV